MRNNYLTIFLAILALLGIIFATTRATKQTFVQSTPNPSVISLSTPSSSSSAVLKVRTKTSGCIAVNSLPDHDCTPGAIDPRVNQDNIQKTICIPGYTKTVRPPVSFTNPLKLKIMQEYGDFNPPQNYEFDHLISLELGGNPTDGANLWPEPYQPIPGAHEKDHVENYLHSQVCAGAITLQQAQQQISQNWLEVYKKISQ